MIKRFKLSTSLILFFMILVTLVGCNPESSEDKRPIAEGFIWEATSSEGEVVTLVGTMHPAPNTHILLNDKLKEILNSSDILTVEVDITLDSNMDKSNKSMYLDTGDTVENYLSQDEITKLSEILKSYNVNIDKVKNYNSHVIAQLISNLVLGKINYNAGSTDTLLIIEAKKNKIEVDEIESMDFQINLLKDLFDWETLKLMINEYDDEYVNEELEIATNLFNNYVNSDIESAEKIEVLAREKDGEAYNIVSTERNKGMADKIDELIKDGKKRVVAVGYRHYIGEDSVLDFLEEKGYTISKLEVQ